MNYIVFQDLISRNVCDVTLIGKNAKYDKAHHSISYIMDTNAN